MDKCSECGGPKGGIGIPIYGDPRCMGCLAAAGRKKYVEPEQSIRKDIEDGCYPFNNVGHALVPMNSGYTATVVTTRSPAVPGWSHRAGSWALHGYHTYRGEVLSGTWRTHDGCYTNGSECFGLTPPEHPPGTFKKPQKVTFEGVPKTVRDHVLAGSYPLDEDGHAKVRKRNGGEAIIAMVDTPNPYGDLVGWRYDRCWFLWGWYANGRSFDDGWREGKDDLLLPDGRCPVAPPNKLTRKYEPLAVSLLARAHAICVPRNGT